MTSRSEISPLVGLPADVRIIDGAPFHAVGDKYARAVALAARATPMLLPALGELQRLQPILDALDGVVLTGSISNVHPTHYGDAPTPEAEPYDEARDVSTLPLIETILEQGIPLLAICRGFQELNVALGGTLHTRVHEVSGRSDHRAPQSDDDDEKYGAQHGVTLNPDGPFARLGHGTQIEVNSLHWQGIARLADRLAPEGVAADGTIEAVSVRNSRAFALGVQWHPEYKVLDNAFSRSLFEAFGDAARARAAKRRERQAV